MPGSLFRKKSVDTILKDAEAGLSDGELAEITSVLRGLYPKYTVEESSFSNLFTLMQKDKKNHNGKVNCTLISHIGSCSIDHICTVYELYESLRYYASLN